MNRLYSIAFVLISSLVLQVACSTTVPATVTRMPPFPLDKEGGVWLIAQRQRPAIVASLEEAGIRLAENFRDTEYSLEVQVGSSRGSSKCGSTNNVSYSLNSGGRRVMTIKGRGATGSCKPGIFDDMSRKLADHMN